MLSVAFNCLAAANAQESVEPLILYGDEASKVWNSFDKVNKYKKDRFYGTDTTFTVSFTKVTANIPESLDTDRMDTVITVPGGEITGFTFKEVANALGSDVASVSENQKEITVPISRATVIESVSDAKIAVPVSDIKITANIPAKVAVKLTQSKIKLMTSSEIAAMLDMDPHIDCIRGCVIVVPDAKVTAKIPHRIARQDRDNENSELEISSSVKNVKIHLKTVFWNCSTPNPSAFWSRLLIRSEKEVVVCVN